MPHSHDLTKLDERSFEHLSNALALRVLGAGHTGFGPGSDGGRDGFFEGEAPYPSGVNRWTGRWYLQSKFHRPHLSADPQKWLLERISDEIKEFEKTDTKRIWPDNWIVVTNIDPSGSPQTGAFDRARKLVGRSNKRLAKRFHIWGGAKVLQLLASHPEIEEYYSHFLTPGHVLSKLYHQLGDDRADIGSIVRHFVVTQFNEQQFTKLEQAGSTTDSRPGIHHLFTDLPFRCDIATLTGMSAEYLARAAAQNFTADFVSDDKNWSAWKRYPSRARVWFIKGGPGQGKSTLTQYLAQIQRACLMLGEDAPAATPQQREVAREIRGFASDSGFWPIAPRIPVYLELKDFAKWFGDRPPNQARGVLSFLADRLSQRLEQTVHVGTLKRAFAGARWLFVFDGLDEVPSDVKDDVADEVTTFIDDQLIAIAADAYFVCTSRPQGYAGQFASLNAAEVELVPLSPAQALRCATPVLQIDRDKTERDHNLETLREALQSPSIREIMTTPLQSHIMAVVVRDGGRPPDRKWRLFANFYQVIKKREANRNLPDKRISTLLRTADKLLKSLHNRLGYELHARAEVSQGAQTSINRSELSRIIHDTVYELQSTNVNDVIDTLMEATTERLVLVNTPEAGTLVRFDIRPLQEFFAAEFIYEDVSAEKVGDRIALVAGDPHWREVMHFLLSALIENSRRTDLVVAIEKLAYLNERDDSSPARFFYRRLAVGAVLAARLLAENVLEQDKRVRQQFKKCLEPLFGSTEVDLSTILAQVSGRDSTSWLIEVLSDTLLEQAEGESIGAAFLLCLLIPDNHSALAEIRQGIISRSPQYRLCLFRMLAKLYQSKTSFRDKGGSEWSPPEWVTELALRSLASENWMRLTPEGVRSALRLVSADNEILAKVAVSVGISEHFVKILVPLLRPAEMHRRRGNATSENWGGLIQASFIATPSTLDPETWDEDVRGAIAQAPGIFSMIHSLFAIASGSRSLDAVSLIANYSAFFPVLPEKWAAYIPTELLNFRADDGNARTHFAANTNLTWKFKPGYTADLEFGFNDIWSITGLAAKDPDLTFHLYSLGLDETSDSPSNSWQKIKKIYNSPAGREQLEAVCLAYPKALVNVVNIWGALLKTCDYSEAVRNAMLASCRFWNPEQLFFSSSELFILRLPQEAKLLPLFASVVYYVDAPHLRSERKPSAVSLQECAPDINLLMVTIKDAEIDATLRGCAGMMVLAHPDRPTDQLDLCIQSILDGYVPLENSWYLGLAAASLEDMISNGDIKAISTMGGLLRAGANDLPSRFHLDRVFRSWRERSQAPISKVGINSF